MFCGYSEVNIERVASMKIKAAELICSVDYLVKGDNKII